MEPLEFKDVYMGSFLSHWTRVSTFTKPVIAAVNGYAVSICGGLVVNMSFLDVLFMCTV